MMNYYQLPTTETDKIFRLHKGIWCQIASGKSSVKADGDCIPAIDSVIASNQSVVNFIGDFRGSEIMNPETRDTNTFSFFAGPEYDRMEILYLTTYCTRRSNVYFFLQYNHRTKNVRTLAYGTDHINHSAACFGTPLECVSKDNLVSFIASKVNDNSLQKKIAQRHMTTDFKNALGDIASVNQLHLTF